jgi:hypothetical protein
MRFTDRSRRLVSLAALGLSLTVAARADARVLDPRSPVVLENDRVSLQFRAGSMGLEGLVDLVSGVDHVKDSSGAATLWELEFAAGAQRRTLSSTEIPCTQASIRQLGNGRTRLLLEWLDVPGLREAQALSVRVTVELSPGDGVARWRILVHNRSDHWGLWSIAFPKIGGLPSKGGYDIARPVFSLGGRLLPRWERPIKGAYPSGQWSMQLAALTNQGNSVYVGTEDPDGWRKDFEIDPAEETLLIRHYPENMAVPGSDFPDVYPTLLGVYQGDWRQAAMRYRKWALRQEWAATGPISQRADWPDRLDDIGYWVVYDFPLNDPEKVALDRLPAILEHARTALETDIGVHWYRWHQVPFDNLYPHFLPPVAQFDEITEQLVKQGFTVMPYINGVSLDRNIADYEEFAGGAIKDQAGGVLVHDYLETSGRLLAMCGGDGKWQETVADLVRSLVDGHGVNAVYVDQISAVAAQLCFDSQHDHPAGGGDHWVRGYRDLMRLVQDVAKRSDRQAIITSEAPSEVFLDVLDANLTWGEHNGLEIPLFEMVYSGYTVSFGSICSLDRSEAFFRRTQGTAMLDGRQLGWLSPAIFEEEHAAKVRYLNDALAFRESALRYLLYGRLVQPLNPSSSVPVFEETLKVEGDERTMTLPGAEARIWRDEAGSTAILFANFLEEEVLFPYGVTREDLGLPAGSFRVRRVRPSGATDLGPLTDKLERTERLPPRGFALVEIGPRKTPKSGIARPEVSG